MEAKEKAEQLVKKHLTAIAEETMDSDGIILYSAKQCAKVTVDEILNTGIFATKEFWKEVKIELEKM